MKIQIYRTILFPLIILGCSQEDEAKVDYMVQCSNWTKSFIENEGIKVGEIDEFINSSCECGFKRIETDFRRNRGKLKNDKMYWIPLEMCIQENKNR